KLALLDEIIDGGRGEYRKIECGPLLDLRLQRDGRTKGKDDHVPSRFFECRRKLFQRCLERVGTHHPDLGGIRRDADREDHDKSDCGGRHRILLHSISSGVSMIRTIISLDEESKEWLDRQAKQENISTAASYEQPLTSTWRKRRRRLRQSMIC